jgi:hypothetical protein
MRLRRLLDTARFVAAGWRFADCCGAIRLAKVATIR